MSRLTEKQAKLFTDPNYGWAITIRSDGTPHATAVWIDYDGDCVLFNTSRHTAKWRQLEHDPRVTVAVLDPYDWKNFVSVTGRAELAYDGAEEHIHKLARKYWSEDFDSQASKERVIVRVSTDHVVGSPFITQ